VTSVATTQKRQRTVPRALLACCLASYSRGETAAVLFAGLPSPARCRVEYKRQGERAQSKLAAACSSTGLIAECPRCEASTPLLAKTK